MGRLSRVLLRLLLRFYPPSSRARWRADLEAAMAACVARERRRLGAAGAVYAWAKLGADALAAGTGLRLDAMRRRKTARRHTDRFRPFRDVWQDVRLGIRALGRAPGLTAVSTITLALGIGAATTVFSVVNTVLIRPLPYPDPEQLVSMWNVPRRANSRGEVPVSATQFFTARDESRVFAAFGLWSSGVASVVGPTEPDEVRVVRVTNGTLQALGVRPQLGRWLAEEDAAPGSTESVILGSGFWKRRLGGDPSVVGRSLIVDSRPRTVVGVMPDDFRVLNESPDLIVPLQFERARLLLGSFNYFAIGRLKPGVTIEQATADAARTNRIWLDAWPSPPGFDRGTYAEAQVVRPLKRDVVGDTGSVLRVLMGAVGLVLLIAWANVAGLLLVRAERRRHDVAVRFALGAGWHRLARESLIETLLLGLLGCAAGLALTVAALRTLAALGPANMPRLSEITVDPVVLSFALTVSVLSSIGFGLMPVIEGASPALAPLLRGAESTFNDGPGRHRTRSRLVVAQISLAVVLLAGSGLMIRTLAALRAVRPGFTDAAQVQLARITIPRALIDDPEQVFQIQSQILHRVAAIPGAASASFASAAPMEPFVSANVVFAEGQTEGRIRRFKFVTPGYFATVGTPLVAGRDFDWTDITGRRPVAVVSENMARDMWQNPPAAVGKRIRENPDAPWREIVGVVGDVVDDGVHARAPVVVYWPALMERFEGERIRIRRSMTFVVRSSRAGSEGFLREIQQAVWAVNATLPVARVQTLAAIYEASLARTSFTLVTIAVAASLSLLLGLVGIYGAIAHAVTRRTREIGIRVALGARPGELGAMFIGQGLLLGAAGLGVGLAAAFAGTRLMSSLLFGVSPLDPVTYLAVCLVVMPAAAAASYIPARQAIRQDPLAALRASC